MRITDLKRSVNIDSNELKERKKTDGLALYWKYKTMWC